MTKPVTHMQRAFFSLAKAAEAERWGYYNDAKWWRIMASNYFRAAHYASPDRRAQLPELRSQEELRRADQIALALRIARDAAGLVALLAICAALYVGV